jgi:hypothetical protein
MTERLNGDTGNDVLGEYYEERFGRKINGQFFTPWLICTLTAKITVEQTQVKEDGPPPYH